MPMTTVTTAPLAGRGASTARALGAGRRVATAGLVIGFALLTWAGARISVPLPFTPVPGTLQTLAVLMAGGLLGARAGAASQIVYLMMGMAGLPVFALPGAGPAYLLGPTGGYLIGFVIAAWTTGMMSVRVRSLGLPGAFLAYLAGSVAIYFCGLTWLAIFMGGDLAGALKAGLAPFVLFDLAKIVALTGVHAGYRRLGFAGGVSWRQSTPR
jgi:biotin transport system substrate-specific component